jgi:cold shock CspA family protein
VTHAPATAFSTRTGAVATFDDHVGAGTIVEDGQDDWSFHCTSIADGTRQIDVGTAVCFEVRPGPNGLEAFGVTPNAPTR